MELKRYNLVLLLTKCEMSITFVAFLRRNGFHSPVCSECHLINRRIFRSEMLNNSEIWPVLHAEMNAIAKVSSSTESSEDATLFITHAPCIHCAKAIYQSGIKNVFYILTP